MTDIDIRKKILNALYQEYRKTPGYGCRDVWELSEEFGIARDAMEFNAHFLVDQGFAVIATAGWSIELTPKGLNFVEGPSVFNPTEQFRQQIIEIHGGNIGQINQGHIINNPSLFLNQLAEMIENNPNLEPEQKASWNKALWEMSKHPALIEVIRALVSVFRV